MDIPKHIAIIPDGNRRWAKKNKLVSFLGHNKGAEIIEKIIIEAIDSKIHCLTFWGCSINNITKRPKSEVAFLFKIFEQQFENILKNKNVHDNKIKINVFGRWKELFPQKTSIAIEKAIEKTKNYNNYRLNFLLAYSGKDEMTTAISKIVESKSKNTKLKINSELIKNNLWTKDLPPVDLIIRTGEENSIAHWSDGFMMWDVSDSRLYFTETLWPDFNKKEFKKAISDYSSAEKRFGK